MHSSEALHMIGRNNRRGRRLAIAPVLGLFFTAPLIAEFLLGNLPIKMLAALIVLAPMYGGGALLIREIVRRSGRGWPSVILLGIAYGIFEEAFVTQSLFDPNYLKLNLGLLTPAFIPALGIGAWWTLWMLMVHGLWSISTPISLIEACVPERARMPWMGKAGLAIVVSVFLLGSTAASILNYRTNHFLASKSQFAGAASALMLFVLLAFSIPTKRPVPAGRKSASAVTLGAVALILASAAMFVPKVCGWGAVAALFALNSGMLLTILAWARKGPMSLRHQLALGAGAALAYGCHAFLQQPSVGGLDVSARLGNAIFLTLTAALIFFAAKQVGAREESVTAN